ncbi:MAG: BON domain-containing protein [Pirellulaceae bacterium]|nr:BON domain-containing protein [Pirellulaceae bacterium]
MLLDAIAASPYPSIRRLDVNVDGGQIVISGSVESFFLKQLAQETVKPHSQGDKIVNCTTVRQ